jgi:Flp pilus assembly protein TadG
MLSHMFLVLRIYLSRFARHSAGSVAPTFAIALIPLLAGVGAAIDYSRASTYRTVLQEALDASLLAAAKDGGSSWQQIATDTFHGDLQRKIGSASTPSFAQTSAELYTGSVSGTVPTTVMGLFNISAIPVSVTATATAAGSDDSCILTLDRGQPTSHVSLSLNGAPVVNLSGCSIRSNTAIDCNGHDGNSTESIAAGVAADCNHPASYQPVVPDVYTSLAANIGTVCGSARPGVTWVPGSLPTGPGIIPVNKGGYTEYHICGDLKLSGSGYLTGQYPTADSVIIIENGSLTIANNASISTSRTAIVMTGNNSYPSQINFPTGNGQSASLSLSAPIDSSDPWQGVALYQDPSLTYQVNDSWGPGATFNADGLVYLGNANVVTNGNTGSSNSKCSKFVMNSFTTNGSVDLNLNQQINACSALGLKQWGGILVHLIK